MSFGIAIGDFIAIIDHANKLRKVFVGAPSQFKELSDEYVFLPSYLVYFTNSAKIRYSSLRNLHILVQDIDVDLSTSDLSSQQANDLQTIKKRCSDTLSDIEKMVNRYSAKETHRIGRIWRRVTWDPDEVRQLRERICVNISNLNAFNGRLVRLQVSDVLMNMSNEQDQLCLDWLSSTNYAAQQYEHSGLRQPKAGKWFMESQMFQEWVKTPQQTLFCPGIPGAGKTIIVSAVIDELEAVYGDSPEVGIAYIYFDFQYLHDQRQKVNTLLACLTRQLLQRMPKVPPEVVRLFNNHRSRGTRPSIKEISGVLWSTIKHFQRVFIIADALDELNNPDQFLDEIFSLQAKEEISFLATARFMPEIMARFQQMRVQEIQASREDVRDYLSASLKNMRSLSRMPELHPEIIEGISDAVDGM